MDYTLTNGKITAILRDFGAELISLKDEAGTEYLWQGDPVYWSGQAPVLFPIVGCLREGKAQAFGKPCSMKRHGIARKRTFRLVQQDDSSISFSLRADEESLRDYPFDFELAVTYSIQGRSLTTCFEVKNHGEEPLPYVVGGHPAFNCSLAEGERFEDYYLEFSQNERAELPLITPENGLIDVNKRVLWMNEVNILPLQHSNFYSDALVFDSLRSRAVTLKNKYNAKGLRVDFPDFAYLGIWSAANDAPFVAIEPWTGISTCSDEGDVFEEKRGMRVLNAGEQGRNVFTVTLG